MWRVFFFLHLSLVNQRIGKFKALGIVFTSEDEITKTVIKRWLTKSEKNHKKLVKLTAF